MTDSWDDRRRALEDGYFDRANKEALERMARRDSSERLSPVTRKPMQQLPVFGVVIDLCADSSGIWLDAGELSKIVQAAKEASPETISALFLQLPQSSSTGAALPTELLSPVSGQPMISSEVTGVPVNRCPVSGGVWLYTSDLRKVLTVSDLSMGHAIRDFFVKLLASK